MELNNEEDYEIDTVMILTKKMKLRTITGQLIVGYLKVYECEHPYIIIILLETDYGHSLRMDVQKEDLAYELRLWLEGKQIRNPAVLVPLRIEDTINRFVKFGKTPLQEDLIMWLLSRSELYLDGDSSELVFGGKESMSTGLEGLHITKHTENEYEKNSFEAMKNGSLYAADQYRMQDGEILSMNGVVGNTRNIKTLDIGATNFSKRGGYERSKFDSHNDQGMFAMTRKLLGKSITLDMVKKTKVKGREGARQSMNTAIWTSDQYRLVSDVEKARKNVESAMDERRRMIEVAKARQLQAAERYRKIREELKDVAGAGKFNTAATHELLSLQKIEADIQEDIKKQRSRAHRTSQKVRWTMAPPGFHNRRGKSLKGPLLGPGPLHPNATSSLKDPRIEQTIRKYYWDPAGRRHIRDGNDDAGNESLVEKAMDAIRRAAANISAFKLDLKAVFERFDTSGDGFLSAPEMAEAFLSMGVPLDVESMKAIFKHFDPNDSGTVHFGEFVWAFFNRRGLVRQWKRKTESMTEAQIKSKFHLSDINGDGRLNPKEFKKLLKSFGIEITEQDVKILISRFDVDNDGDVDLNEFRTFIESEQKNLTETNGKNMNHSSVLLPTPKSKEYKFSRDDTATTSPLQQRVGKSSNSNTGRSSSSVTTQPRPYSAGNTLTQSYNSSSRVSTLGHSTGNHSQQRQQQQSQSPKRVFVPSRTASMANQSLVERALEAIRIAATNKAKKLDLKTIFKKFDRSGDGYLTLSEMSEAFYSLGVQLDVETLTAVYKHFDPNGSGSVYYGEFVWAFFNRRGLIKQWREKTKALSDAGIKAKFQAADMNGDGKLSIEEFKKCLSSFGIELSLVDIDILISRFDRDGDRLIDLHEFRNFVATELKYYNEATDPIHPPRNISNNSSSNSKATADDTRTSLGSSKTVRIQEESSTTALKDSKNMTYPIPSINNSSNNNIRKASLTQIPEVSSNHSMSLEEDLDSLWVARMLKAQAEVEARVGKRYFN